MTTNQIISVVGGVYEEKCLWPSWHEIYGSGGRAIAALAELHCRTNLYTYTNCEGLKILQDRNILTNSQNKVIHHLVDEIIEFYYLHGLSTPRISKYNLYQPFEVKEKNILQYGMLEADILVHGYKVVYDPQNPLNPQPFEKNGSSAEALALVLNSQEARLMVDKQNEPIINIAEQLLEKGASLVVIKQGAHGVFVHTGEATLITNCYETNSVWKIGSGDVFAAHFAYRWMVENLEPFECVELASKATAFYCNTKGFPNHFDIEKNNFLSIPIGFNSIQPVKVYLAGPFFSLAQLWLIEEVINALESVGLKVFSPYHEIGPGEAHKVVVADLKAIDDSHLVFAICNGMDSGTIFEIGYARAKNKPVIVYSENEKPEDLKMMVGSNCIITNDYVSAIYKTLWEAQKL